MHVKMIAEWLDTCQSEEYKKQLGKIMKQIRMEHNKEYGTKITQQVVADYLLCDLCAI